MKRWKKVVEVYYNLFNAKFAVISAVFNGMVAMMVNSAHCPGV